MFRNESRINLIRKGWHRVFAYTPTSTLDGGLVWWKHVERKYYAIGFDKVVKKGINEDELSENLNLHVMHRTVGSDAEKKIYHSGGRTFRDPNEIVRDHL